MKLNLRSVDLNLLPVFVAVVDEGQLSRAAVRLGMSQPAVSAALQRLRLTVGDPLFTRSRAGLSPTPRAQALYQSVSAGLHTLADALDPGQHFHPATAARTFRLLAVDYFETLALGPLMAALRSQSATIGIHILAQQAGWVRTLLNAEADFALDTQVPEDDRLQAKVVGEESLAVVVRQSHPVISDSLSLEEFLAAEHVVLPLNERRTLPLDQILGRPGWHRKVGAQVVQYSNLLSVASASDLIATVPLRLAQHLAPGLKLQVLPFPVPTPKVPIYLIWPKALEQDRAHLWFREFLEMQLLA
ncbi:LysR substrate-binding domain-containing protein [Marinobacter caseinilyticus]|uniref:LysR substrate-binding domain-containing protein n=1 Tax=Marinobacter caseinilyticus TaxID=2692195 RepID=UPI00140AE5F1|nr:LysR substrate-binding domain-containing protein [Marinobacter caseinilyticus]